MRGARQEGLIKKREEERGKEDLDICQKKGGGGKEKLCPYKLRLKRLRNKE